MSLLSDFFPASFDDLVFEGRNQAYGAYQLRQAYNGHLRTAMMLMVGLCALLLLGGAAWQHLHPLMVIKPTSSSILTPITPPTYVTEPPKPIVPPAAPAQPRLATAPATHTAASIPTKVVKDELAIARKPETIAIEVPAETPGVIGSTTDAANTGLATSTGTATTGSETGTDASPAVTGPYVVVEKMPEFAGGMEALTRYLRSHLRYPTAALAAQAEGRVFVSFVVQADGTIADITVPKGLGYGLDEEAQRVVRQMPAWTPGQQSHHAVPVRFTLPITFRIQ
jgi:protein TonB